LVLGKERTMSRQLVVEVEIEATATGNVFTNFCKRKEWLFRRKFLSTRFQGTI